MAPYIDEYSLTASEVLGSSAILKQNLAVNTNPQRHSIFRRNFAPRPKHSMKTINIGLLVCTLLTLFFALCYLLFDPLVRHITLRQLVLKNNSDFAEIWENPPITPHLKIYFFNLSNPEAVFEGKELPNVTEVGPYVYHQKWIKENVQWHANGTMTYSTRKIFHFQENLSVGSHSSDLITTLNVPAISAFYMNKDAWLTWAINFGITNVYNKMWVKHTPEELIWGHDEPLFALAEVFGQNNIPPNGKFAFFPGKNDSSELPRYTMFTGENNPYNLSKISLFNGKDSLNMWGNPKTEKNTCNAVKGSDGSTFNPYIEKDDTLWFFNDQLCQSMPLVFEKEITSVEIPGYRFIPRADVFTTPRTTPENDCFCADEPLCDMVGDGMFVVAKCQMEAPIILSWPHFLHANSSFQRSVHGLNPDKEKHGFHFDIQQTTGTTIAAKARIQINMAVKQLAAFPSLSKVNDSVIPILWFEEGLDQLGPELREVIGAAVIQPPIYKNYILCILLGLGISTLFISVIAGIRLCLNKRHAKKLASRFDDIYCSSASISDIAYHQCRPGGFAGDEENMLKNVRNILHERIPQHHSIVRLKNNQSNHIEAAQKLLSGDSQLTSAETSTESSRISSASHSRNSSTGSNPGNANVTSSVPNAEGRPQDQTAMTSVLSTFVPLNTSKRLTTVPAVASSQALLDPETKLPNV